MDWNDIILDPTDYAFRLGNGIMLPFTNSDQIAPSDLLEKIKYSCNTTCINCTYASLAINCSIACLNCNKAESSCQICQCKNMHLSGFISLNAFPLNSYIISTQ